MGTGARSCITATHVEQEDRSWLRTTNMPASYELYILKETFWSHFCVIKSDHYDSSLVFRVSKPLLWKRAYSPVRACWAEHIKCSITIGLPIFILVTEDSWHVLTVHDVDLSLPNPKSVRLKKTIPCCFIVWNSLLLLHAHATAYVSTFQIWERVIL